MFNKGGLVFGQLHVMSRGMLCMAMHLVESLLVLLSKFKYGDLCKYRITRPAEGPFYLKDKDGKCPLVDVGAVDKIK